MIGNQATAQRVSHYHHTGQNGDGIEFIGEGCSRAVYLVGDVVYKVEIGEYGCNEMEARNYNNLVGHLPDGWGIAKCYLYDIGNNFEPVLAMQYIEGRCWVGESHYLSQECNEACEALGHCILDEYAKVPSDDVHDGNYIIEAGTGVRVLIDYAM